jgi:hypothetical protein
VEFRVASLVYGVFVFAIIGNDGYFANSDTQWFSIAVALVAWLLGVLLLRAYIFGRTRKGSTVDEHSHK